MASDQAQIDTAKLNIAYCHIVSPVSGRVGLRLVDPGNYLQPSDTTGIVVITQIDPISVIFSTPEDNLPQITARLNSGATLPVTAFDRSNVKQLATGTLTTFDNEVDTTTGTFKLRATFANPDNVLFPNQFVNVRLLVDTLSGAVLAPNAAIQLGASGSFVYVVNDDSTVAVRNVTTGPADAKNTTIVSGLAVGENVVIDGVDRLRDGAKVSVPQRRGRSVANRAPANPGTGDGTAPPSTTATKAPRGAAPPPSGRYAVTATRNRRRAMNPSRLFIERPVATTLLMFAILMVGVAAYKFLPLSALPEVDYPTIQVQTFYPGASPEVMTSSVTAPLERQFGQMPSLSQMMSQSSAGSSVITLRFSLDFSLDIAEQEVQAAINAAGNLLPADLPAPPIYAKVNPADAPILTLGVTSKTLQADRCRGYRRKPARAETVAIPRRRPGLDFRRAASGGAHPRQSAGARRLRDQSRRSPNDDRQSQRQHAEGQFRRPVAILRHQRQRPDPRSQRLPQFGRRLSQQRARSAERRRHGRDRGGEQPAFRLDEHDAGADRQHPAPAGRQRHSGRRQHQEPAADI